MSWNPSSIFYACVAKGTTILAEFNSRDADLGDLARNCLENTPPFHSTFSHTVGGKTYLFFIRHPFVYFGIFDETLERSACLSFLESVRDSFVDLIQNCSPGTIKRRLEPPRWHCLQGEFSPVFHHLLGSNSESDMVLSPLNLKHKHESGESFNYGRKKSGRTPLLKIKNRFLGGEGNRSSCDVDGGVSSGCRLQKANFRWKKQVIVVLSMDLIVCVALFAIWLWICGGFQCIAT